MTLVDFGQKAIMDEIQPFVAPVWASTGPNQRPSDVDHNGTITFVELGGRKLGITAYHVLAKFREKKAEDSRIRLAINLSSISAFLRSVRVVDESPERDIAVIDFPDLREFPRHSKRFFIQVPIEPVEHRDAVTIIGFPGEFRRGEGSLGRFSSHGIGMTVSNHPRDTIQLVTDPTKLRTFLEKTGSERTSHVDPGGMSGSAGFFLRGNELRLAGFVKEGRPDWVLLVAATVLEPGGTILR